MKKNGNGKEDMGEREFVASEILRDAIKNLIEGYNAEQLLPLVKFLVSVHPENRAREAEA